MTDRFGYFVATVAENPEGVAEACRMFRHVDSAFVLRNGKVICVLSEPLRDEADGFGPLAKAVEARSAVTRVEGHILPLAYDGDMPYGDLLTEVAKAVAATQPTVPDDDGVADHGCFAREVLAWRRTGAALHAALEGLRRRPFTPEGRR